jgi:hypothetical protein
VSVLYCYIYIYIIRAILNLKSTPKMTPKSTPKMTPKSTPKMTPNSTPKKTLLHLSFFIFWLVGEGEVWFEGDST